MKLRFHRYCFILHPSSFILFLRRRSQVVRQRSAKPLFIGSIPIAASKLLNTLQTKILPGGFGLGHCWVTLLSSVTVFKQFFKPGSRDLLHRRAGFFFAMSGAVFSHLASDASVNENISR